jgi:hypothetical protein
MLRALPTFAPLAFLAASADLVRPEIRLRSFSASNSRYSPTSSAQYFLPEGEVAEARP